MASDCELLCRYSEQGDEAAFAEVVQRHVNLVYASAVRLLNGNATLAQDVLQEVFTDLARKAGALSGHTSVAGWLHTSARFAAAKALRAEQRRQTHEQEAIAMTDLAPPDVQTWVQLRPLIDEAVGQLREPERDAVLLRFFEEKSHREVGEALGLTENAARMRVERGLEKLRAHFARHGVTATVALLASTLGAQAASAPAPAEITATLAAQSLAGVAVSSAGDAAVATAATTTWLPVLLMSKFQTTVVGLLLLALVLAAWLFNFNFGSANAPAAAGRPASIVLAPGATLLVQRLALPTTPVAKVSAPPAPVLTGNDTVDLHNNMVDIVSLLKARDVDTLIARYSLPDEKDGNAEVLNRFLGENEPWASARWKFLIGVMENFQTMQPVLLEMEPGPSTHDSGLVARYNDTSIYTGEMMYADGSPLVVPVDFIKVNGRWYLRTMTIGNLYSATHNIRSSRLGL